MLFPKWNLLFVKNLVECILMNFKNIYNNSETWKSVNNFIFKCGKYIKYPFNF